MSYNPFDLVSLRVNGKEIYGRPFEFDSEIVGADMTNEFGDIVKPTKVSTVCPDCGQGIEVITNYDDPPFPVVDVSCFDCNPSPVVESVSPFVDPLAPDESLDPAIYSGNDVIKDDGLTAAERISNIDELLNPEDTDFTSQLEEAEEEAEEVVEPEVVEPEVVEPEVVEPEVVEPEVVEPESDENLKEKEDIEHFKKTMTSPTKFPFAEDESDGGQNDLDDLLEDE